MYRISGKLECFLDDRKNDKALTSNAWRKKPFEFEAPIKPSSSISKVRDTLKCTSDLCSKQLLRHVRLGREYKLLQGAYMVCMALTTAMVLCARS